jgi:hypothetical protein
VVIVGLPSAATCPPEKTWRAAAGFVSQRLHARFGPDIGVTYVDLFSAEMADHPDVEALVADGHLPPLVLIDGALAASGGKLNVSAIERAVAAALASTPRREVAIHA